ncbi:hypothetical protein OIV83_000126 [Microbotryomycetes sp. JL201]|nr:hypothetical protein OIV83_000126 [Microbotryomycetes sp. JL201]
MSPYYGAKEKGVVGGGGNAGNLQRSSLFHFNCAMPRNSIGTPRSSLWPQGAYDGGSAFKPTQTRLAPLDRRSLVTSRAKDTQEAIKHPHATPKQRTLQASFAAAAAANQHTPAPDPDMTAQHSRDKEINCGYDIERRLLQMQGARAETPPRTLLGQTILVAGQGQSTPMDRKSSIGRQLLKVESGVRPKRGPTLAFDGQDPPLNDREFEGDSQRKAAVRVIEGAPGQLDLLPADDFVGFGSSISRKRQRKTLDLSSLPRQSPPRKQDLPDRSAFHLGSRSNSDDNRSRHGHQGSSSADDTLSEPTTIDDSGRPEDDGSSISSKRDFKNVQTHSYGIRRAPNLLVPDSSDNEDADADCSRLDDGGLLGGLNIHFGQAGDDSGFAEAPQYLDDDELGDVFLVPATPAKRMTARRYPRPSLPAPSESQHESSSDTEQDVHDVISFLIPNTQSLAHQASSLVDGSEVICHGTQTLMQDLEPHETIVRATPSPHKSPRGPTVKFASSSQSRRKSDQAWHSLKSAWQGQRPITPARPPSPRQRRLGEYFLGATQCQASADDDEDDDETDGVADSQDCGNGMTLEQAVAFKEALDQTRRMGRDRSDRNLKIIEEQPDEIRGDEGVDNDDNDAANVHDEHVHEMVETSDPEDGPFSPLTSPVKSRAYDIVRIPLVDGIMKGSFEQRQLGNHCCEASVASAMFQPKHPSQGGKCGQASEPEPETEGTTYESYWTLDFDSPARLDELELPSASLEAT